MTKNYKIEEYTVESLYVNPDNARYINSDELLDEESAIRQLIKLYQSDIVKLAEDISSNGLNPNELPIIVPGPDNDNMYLVMDGNRRITSIKLMTQYKNRLKELGVSAASRKFLQGLKCNIKVVNCVLYAKDDLEVNDLLEKLHTFRPGISQKKWDPQSQDRHQQKNGGLTKRLAIIELLRASEYATPEAKSALNKARWTSKLKRFADYETDFFGIGFDEDNNIILFLEEREVIKALSQLVIDLMAKHSNEIAQTVEVRKNYLNNFPSDKKPDFKKTVNPPILFKVDSKTFDITKAEPLVTEQKPANSSGTYQNDGESGKAPDKNGNAKSEKGKKPSSANDNSGSSNAKKNQTEQEDNSKTETEDDLTPEKNGTKSTHERTTLIPKEENIPISDQRTKDLYDELKVVNIRYVNVISTSLRSLIEFSLNIYLHEKHPRFAFNEQVKLIDKLEKVIRILENTHSKGKLEDEIPAIYKSIASYNKTNTPDNNSIQLLNLLLHNHNYHPIEKELKSLYNNYSGLLNLIWNEL